MVELAAQVIIVVFLAAGSAALTKFYSFCIGEPHEDEVKIGRIFSWFGLWLELKYDAFEKAQNIQQKREIDLLMNQQFTGDKFLVEQYKVKSRRKLNYYKPLGCCPYCTSPYISTLTHVPIYIVFGLSWWFFLFGLVLSVAFLTYFMKK